jgi:D-lactate dehydrogenase
MFAPADGSAGVQNALPSLAAKAGVALITPERLDGLCCGTPWKSKGMARGYRRVVGRTLKALRVATDSGQLPVVVDNSSCAEGLRIAVAARPGTRLEVRDAVEFAAERLLPEVRMSRTAGRVVVHPTCSGTIAGSTDALLALAGAAGDEVVVPDDWGCCAFAGDRGLLRPELTGSATSAEARDVAVLGGDHHVSSNRTCEIGMTRATGLSYRHVLELVGDHARARAR